MDVEDEASRRAMEAADEIKEEGTEVMPTATPNPPETGGVEAMKTGKGRPSWSVGTVARKATGKVSVGRSAPIRREPVPETAPDIPTREIRHGMLVLWQERPQGERVLEKACRFRENQVRTRFRTDRQRKSATIALRRRIWRIRKRVSLRDEAPK